MYSFLKNLNTRFYFLKEKLNFLLYHGEKIGVPHFLKLPEHANLSEPNINVNSLTFKHINKSHFLSMILYFSSFLCSTLFFPQKLILAHKI